ncbi:MAG: 50S ribosomal protein L3 [Mariprofundaceae bacterium]|nr:50S ribosomal protein L3 [Mariprofundaceae bacterium]
MAGLIARKSGMTQVFAENGHAVPVTVLEIEPCKVIAIRTADADGYEAVQVGYGKEARHTSRAVQGHYAKQGQDVMRSLKEFRTEIPSSFKLGQDLTASMFEAGQKVDVSGTSKGRGFAGVMKRWNFAGGRATHGAEKTHRQMGSTGQCQDPGRVFPGKKMPGHYGAERSTVECLTVVRVDENRLLVKGAVPGSRGGLVEVRLAKKG